MKKIETTVYEFDELSDDAKEKAREWYREIYQYEELWDTVYEDAKTIGLEISGLDLYHNTINGRFDTDAYTVAERIMENHGESCDTYTTAGNYKREYNKLDKETPGDDDLDTYEIDKNFLYMILQDYLLIFHKEEEYLMSNESVDENIRMNEYTFTEDGTKFS